MPKRKSNQMSDRKEVCVCVHGVRNGAEHSDGMLMKKRIILKNEQFPVNNTIRNSLTRTHTDQPRKKPSKQLKSYSEYSLNWWWWWWWQPAMIWNFFYIENQFNCIGITIKRRNVCQPIKRMPMLMIDRSFKEWKIKNEFSKQTMMQHKLQKNTQFFFLLRFNIINQFNV